MRSMIACRKMLFGGDCVVHIITKNPPCLPVTVHHRPVGLLPRTHIASQGILNTESFQCAETVGTEADAGAYLADLVSLLIDGYIYERVFE